MIEFLINTYLIVNIIVLLVRLPKSIRLYKVVGYDLSDIAYDVVKQIFAGIFLDRPNFNFDLDGFYNEDETFLFEEDELCDRCGIKYDCVDSPYYKD